MQGESSRKRYFEKDIEMARDLIIGKHKKCNGTGFIEESEKTERGFAKKVVTPCLCRKKFNSISRLVLSNIPYRSLINQQIYGKKVLDCVLDEQIELVSEVIRPYISNLRKVLRSPYGFLLLGKNGTGKTFVGLKVLYYSVVSGYTAHNIELSDFLRLVRKVFNDDYESERVMDEIKNVDILMVDEIGSESKRSEFAISELKSIYKKRVSMGKPTILVSNYSFSDFKKVYGKSISSMVTSHCKVFDFAGSADVRRAKCLVEMDSFFKKLKRGK